MHRSSQRDNQIQIISNLERYPLSGFCSYCGVLAAKPLRSQTKNSPPDCFLNAATVQQEIIRYRLSNLERHSLSGFYSYCGVLAAKLFRFTICGVAFPSEPPIICKLKNVCISIRKNRFPEAIGKAVFDVMFLADKFDCENLFACDFKFSRAVLADREGSNVLFLKADELDLAPLLARISGKLKFCLLSFNR